MILEFIDLPGTSARARARAHTHKHTRHSWRIGYLAYPRALTPLLLRVQVRQRERAVASYRRRRVYRCACERTAVRAYTHTHSHSSLVSNERASGAYTLLAWWARVEGGLVVCREVGVSLTPSLCPSSLMWRAHTRSRAIARPRPTVKHLAIASLLRTRFRPALQQRRSTPRSPR